MLTCAVRGLCIAAVHAIEIVNSDAVNSNKTGTITRPPSLKPN